MNFTNYSFSFLTAFCSVNASTMEQMNGEVLEQRDEARKD